MRTRRKPVRNAERRRAGRARTKARAAERPAPELDLAAAVHALVANVSDDEWKKLPPNLAARVDELLYDRDK